MRLVTPYQTAASLIRVLDNGGRWFNVFTPKNDGVVEEPELKKAAGAWKLATATLFLELATVGFSTTELAELRRAFDPELKSRLAPPEWLRPGELVAEEGAHVPVVTLGTFRFREKTSVTTYTTTTTTDGEGNTSVITTPSTQEFLLYDITDPEMDGTTLVAVSQGPELAGGVVRVAGYLGRTAVDDRGRKELTLDVHFYTPLAGEQRFAPGESWLTGALRHRVS